MVGTEHTNASSVYEAQQVSGCCVPCDVPCDADMLHTEWTWIGGVWSNLALDFWDREALELSGVMTHTDVGCVRR